MLWCLQLCVAACLEEDFQQCEGEHLSPVDAAALQRQRRPRGGRCSIGWDPRSDAWLCLTSVCDCPQRWEESHLFENDEQATLFLGVLDSIFLFSYAVVRHQCFFSPGFGGHVIKEEPVRVASF